MASMVDTATRFFEECESGKGWKLCSQYCTEDATFAAQAEPLSEIKDHSRRPNHVERGGVMAETALAATTTNDPTGMLVLL